MINCNGQIVNEETVLTTSNRGFLYGDAVFETCKVVNKKVLFFEDHYFRLMSSMRIVRMKIPMNFTLEFLESEILSLVEAIEVSNARIRITVYRNDGGLYLPKDNSVSYTITANPIQISAYVIGNQPYEVDLYKDFYVSKQLLSSIKTTNRMINITGSVFAQENDLQNCLLLNDDKNVVEALNGNLFMLNNTTLITPPVSDGCLNGVMRKQILSLAKKIEGIAVVEQSISAFELQKADELFITNVISGIQPITKYRKKEYATAFSQQLIEKLNESLV
ncbi:aminotransferase class IV [Flavobacterium sp.]|uniref:aminotransferase class IV n=1 Tax=Flavobacterium sp. TaxID=239 RepID=UPI002B4B84F1|nr:aminotransferase class IV [Flavobacterium sp.]HLP65347.1 aminotransferase class IV [Flavobacterium sp.]